ncbi:unnamed protein product, partial [Vitis vinifera]
MTIKFNLQSNQPDQKLQFTTARRKRQVALLQGVKSVKGSKACVKPLTPSLSHPESRESRRPRWAKKLRSVRFLSGAVQLDRLRRWSSAARAGDRGVSGPRRVEAGAFNDLGRRRRTGRREGMRGWRDLRRRRLRKVNRGAGFAGLATTIPQSSMNLCDPSTVDRTSDGKRRKVSGLKHSHAPETRMRSSLGRR